MAKYSSKDCFHLQNPKRHQKLSLGQELESRMVISVHIRKPIGVWHVIRNQILSSSNCRIDLCCGINPILCLIRQGWLYLVFFNFLWCDFTRIGRGFLKRWGLIGESQKPRLLLTFLIVSEMKNKLHVRPCLEIVKSTIFRTTFFQVNALKLNNRQITQS